MNFRACVLVAVLASAATAHAQTTDPPAWDTSASAGIYISRPEVAAETWDHWFHTGQFAVSLGRYFTPHVKAEMEVSVAGDGRQFLQRYVDVPGFGPYPIGSEQVTQTRSVSGVLAWQFYENQWVHPYLYGGVQIDLDRTQLHTWEQSYYRGDPRIPGNTFLIQPASDVDLGTDAHVRGVIGTGAKLYVARRAFFKTDARVALGSRAGNAAFRLGFGVDF